ncbi:hypothetical protein BDZ91DRAFT_718527 [Kalaharituber pfeilii]|nr:hypothetical protein BDZ91DRAFT_718527 [Kalaharituber pfeilii]
MMFGFEVPDALHWPTSSGKSNPQRPRSEPSTPIEGASVSSAERSPGAGSKTASFTHQHNGLMNYDHPMQCANCNALKEQLQASQVKEQNLKGQLLDSDITIRSVRNELTTQKREEEALRGQLHGATVNIHNLKQQLGSQKLVEQRLTEEREILRAKVGKLEEEKIQYQLQMDKLVKQQLESRREGLPLHQDDSYFSHELDNLVSDIRQWARTATRGQPPLTRELLQNIRFPSSIVNAVNKRSLNLFDIIHAKSMGTRGRTRLVEAILCRELLERLIDSRENPVGLKVVLSDISKLMPCSVEARQLWKALTVHRLTNNNENFVKEQQLEVDKLTDWLHSALEPLWCSSPKATKQGLRDIVNKAALLSLEVSKLPFILTNVHLQFEKLDPNWENVDIEVIEEGDLKPHRMAAIVLCKPWGKWEFDAEGKYGDYTMLLKGYVSSLH